MAGIGFTPRRSMIAEAAGFKLVAQGDFWRHPEDTRDFSIQPPPGKPVDEFVLKFQK
jgi:predicted methyltransferase